MKALLQRPIPSNIPQISIIGYLPLYVQKINPSTVEPLSVTESEEYEDPRSLIYIINPLILRLNSTKCGRQMMDIKQPTEYESIDALLSAIPPEIPGTILVELDEMSNVVAVDLTLFLDIRLTVRKRS